MRSRITLAVAGLALAGALAPLATASASCGPDLSSIGGPSCSNPCGAIGNAYNNVDQRVGGVLPDPTVNCIA